MAKHEGEPLLATGVSQPVPGEDALDADDEVIPVRLDGPEEGVRGGWHVPLQDRLALRVEYAEVHGAGMQVDAACEVVSFTVESHEVLLVFGSDFGESTAYPPHGGAPGVASNRIKPLQTDLRRIADLGC
jgi:hypothetical protein